MTINTLFAARPKQSMKSRLIGFIARRTGYVYAGRRNYAKQTWAIGFFRMRHVGPTVSDPAHLLDSSACIQFGYRAFVFSKPAR